MTELLPAALPSRALWADIGALHAAIRRVAPTVKAEPVLGEVPATGPNPYLRVKYQWLGWYKIRHRDDGYVIASGQYKGEQLGADPEQAARRLAERLNAPVQAATP